MREESARAPGSNLPPRGRIFRIIKGPEPVREDFLSDEARGKRPRDTSPDALAHHRGFSVWRTEEQARIVAQRFPKLGSHIAEVALPEGVSLLPFRDTSDHLTALGTPDACLWAVVRIVPVT